MSVIVHCIILCQIDSCEEWYSPKLLANLCIHIHIGNIVLSNGSVNEWCLGSSDLLERCLKDLVNNYIDMNLESSVSHPKRPDYIYDLMISQ